MINIISGAPGAGKSSLCAFLMQMILTNDGQKLLKNSCEKLNLINSERLYPLSMPDKVPIFSDFKAKFKIGYEKYFEPYYINGYYLGLGNGRMNTQFLPPFSTVFLGEAQRYYNSRRSSTFPDHVSRFYELHRHFGLDLYLDVQRVTLIDSNIRELCRHFIEVQNMENEYDELGNIIQTTWNCREFSKWTHFEDYLNTGAQLYNESRYIYQGNIFACYDSFSFFNEFLPEDKPGNDIKYLNHITRSELQNIKSCDREFYERSEPMGYRRVEKKQ